MGKCMRCDGTGSIDCPDCGDLVTTMMTVKLFLASIAAMGTSLPGRFVVRKIATRVTSMMARTTTRLAAQEFRR
ncbi:hypothetical protein CUJ84_pRLN3000051 (plasmid) [Rhizobium leguminosarum]|uniref:Uncharacterized protein n=1 Tax=Rhizobium leguminosarum TaxID=384 RepID=A0A2K9ZG44_RHILE|nr:hypothetical protein CUJ84_pRLN3000051 [Rhizobium leguminosarum]